MSILRDYRNLVIWWAIGLILFFNIEIKTEEVKKKNLPKSAEERLMTYLFTDYNKLVRPVLNSSLPVIIELGVTLKMIQDVSWMDERLKFDPNDFEKITNIRVPCEKLWLPDIVLYNNVEDQSISAHKALAWVNHDGKIFWPPIVSLRSSCKMDISYFPFDDQICFMSFGSWAYDASKVDCVKMRQNVDTGNLVDNGEWSLENTKVVEQNKIFSCCPEDPPFKIIYFFLHLRRRNLYYTFNVILPCAILSCLTIVTFVLPPESGERVALGLTILLAYSVFMLLVAENMPATSELAPIIGIYLTVIMGLTSISVVCSVVILNLHYRGRTLRRPPQFLIRFLERWPRRLLCIVPPPDPTLICPVAYTTHNGLEEIERHMNYNSRCYQEQIKTRKYKMNRLHKTTRLFGNTMKYYTNRRPRISEDIPIELLQNNWFARHQDCNYIDDLDDNNECQNQTKVPVKDVLPNGRLDSPVYRCDTGESNKYSARLHPKMGTNGISQRRSSCSTPWQPTDFDDYAKKCTKRFLHAEYEILCIKEWEYIAIFLDRILLHVFTGILAFSSLWLLYVKPMDKNLNFEREINVTLESSKGS